MSKKGMMIGMGGMATAAAAHAMFACALMAGQPQPELYLAQIAAPQQQTIQSPQWRLATRRARADGEMPVTQTLPPERLHKGLTTC